MSLTGFGEVFPMDTLQQLRDIYTPHPCRTLPNAFWKTATRLPDSSLIITKDARGELSSLVIWEGGRIMSLWCADPARHPLTQSQIAQVPLALVHATALPLFSLRDFALQQPYFRLIHQPDASATSCPAGFAIEPVQPERDLDAVVSILRACYATLHINTEIVRSWIDRPVYDSNLWLWVVDLKTQAKAGLGIAERDPQIPETSLEWIQVHPAYQKMGLGRAIVSELIYRASASVAFITVSGKANSADCPERLYRRCGFTGADVWWLLSDEA
jgi:GNAT superfamily N-acetyltransferase